MVNLETPPHRSQYPYKIFRGPLTKAMVKKNGEGSEDSLVRDLVEELDQYQGMADQIQLDDTSELVRGSIHMKKAIRWVFHISRLQGMLTSP